MVQRKCIPGWGAGLAEGQGQSSIACMVETGEGPDMPSHSLVFHGEGFVIYCEWVHVRNLPCGDRLRMQTDRAGSPDGRSFLVIRSCPGRWVWKAVAWPFL